MHQTPAKTQPVQCNKPPKNLKTPRQCKKTKTNPKKRLERFKRIREHYGHAEAAAHSEKHSDDAIHLRFQPYK